MKGHAGNIMRVDLTNREVTMIPTATYNQWVGGFGIGSALFWDEIDKDYLANSPNITGFEPENVLCIMTGVLGATLAPSGGRVEICGIGPEAYPYPLFTRSNFGGRFGALLKFAGWDGIVLVGKADKPVWLDIRDGDVQFRDAEGIWGLGTYATQEEIWNAVTGAGASAAGWRETAEGSGRLTLQRPAVLCCGQAGENLVRIACLAHDAGCGAGQGGFGAVFGAKNLKAISVLGTKSVQVARPDELLKTRQWASQWFFDLSRPEGETLGCSNLQSGGPPAHGHLAHASTPETFGRAMACYGCDHACRENPRDGGQFPGGEIECVEAGWYGAPDVKRNGKTTLATYVGAQLLEDYGINAYGIRLDYVESLFQRGLLGKGKRIDTDLDYSQWGTEEFANDLLHKVAFKEDQFGRDYADGVNYAAERWGLLEEDLVSGLLQRIYNIGELHWGNMVGYAYMSLFSSRDVNSHSFLYEYEWAPNQKPEISAEQVAKRLGEMGAPWNDELMVDNSEDGIYSIHMARYVAFHNRWVKFWKNSAQFCDWSWPQIFHLKRPDLKGVSPELETRYFNAVTGADITYEDGLEIGRKIWNLERAILVLQGRHRDKEYFPPFPPYNSFVYTDGQPFIQKGRLYPVFADGKWEYKILDFPMSKERMDDFKTIYYELEGWDPTTGWPTRETLEGCGLTGVADEMEARGLID